MAEEFDNSLSGKKKMETTEKVSLSLAELKELMIAAVSAAVQTSSESSAKMISEAFMEARKPYIDPKQIENEATMRTSMREVQKRIDADIKASQEYCQHLQGSNALSDYPSPFGLTSIIKHQTDTGELIGICTNCQRVFRMDDPDYVTQMRRASGNRTSAAGQRWFADPIAIRRRAR